MTEETETDLWDYITRRREAGRDTIVVVNANPKNETTKLAVRELTDELPGDCHVLDWPQDADRFVETVKSATNGDTVVLRFLWPYSRPSKRPAPAMVSKLRYRKMVFVFVIPRPSGYLMDMANVEITPRLTGQVRKLETNPFEQRGEPTRVEMGAFDVSLSNNQLSKRHRSDQ